MGILQPTTVDGRKPANRLRLVVFQVVQDLFHQQYVSLLEGKCFSPLSGYLGLVMTDFLTRQQHFLMET